MGFHQGLVGEAYDRQYSNAALLRRIWTYARPYSTMLWLMLITIILQGVIGALPPVLVARVVDTGQVNTTANRLLIILVLAVLVIEVLGYVFYYVLHRLLARVTADVSRNLATDAFSASIQQDMAFHDRYSSGKIVSRITTDNLDFVLLIQLTVDVLGSVIQSLTVGVILLRTEWRLALALFAFVPVTMLIVSVYRNLARRVTREGMRAMANVNANIKETISGISVAKNFRQEDSIYQDFKTTNETSYRVNYRRGFVLSIVFPTIRTIGGISIALMTYYGALTVTQGLISAGAWYMILLSSDRFLMPVMSITSYWTQVQTGFSAAERIFALIDAKRTVVQTGNYVPTRLEGKIDFNHLQFHYATGGEVLRDFDLHIRPGENVAIVGHTGAGKSSIARLITRFYEFQGGELTIDDRDIRSYDLTALRTHMGIVTQVPFLFEGTVEENIRFSVPGISREEILDLSRRIGKGEWLETFSHGLDTNVGERGSQISMGQRQLVALMRVLAHKPSIFILDEATASIDPFTEKQIQQALNLILEQSTSVLIAHRLSTVTSADRIIVLAGGEIIEEGTHAQLLASGGNYAELYNTYFRHQSLDYVEKAGRLYSSRHALNPE